MASSKSYDAFSSVDKLVAKPVLGSDGAASWQEFRKESKMDTVVSVAPSAPVKRADRLGTGFKTLQEERANEDRLRQQSGEAKVGDGYTHFKRKGNSEDAAERNKKKRIEDRIRPDEKDYFIPTASGFQGWKFDYIFTTRDGRTGYYWDGADSVKKLYGTLEVPEEENKDTSPTESDAPKKVKKKKKKRKDAGGPVTVEDTSNPVEVALNALQRRNEALQAPPSALTGLPTGWEKASDASSGKVYYFNRATGQRQWDIPTEGAADVAPSNKEDTAALPPGWSSAKDSSTGKEYFYHTSGETRWERPSS